MDKVKKTHTQYSPAPVRIKQYYNFVCYVKKRVEINL